MIQSQGLNIIVFNWCEEENKKIRLFLSQLDQLALSCF